MKRTKRLLALLLTLVLVLPALPLLPVHAAEIVESGSCGDNVTYTLDSAGLLTINGTGNMSNYSYYSNSPFYRNADIKTVVIESGVTNIGNYAFRSCTGLTSVTISDGVTNIGSYAFYGCTGLPSVTIGNGVTSIGNSAFYGCTGLTSVTIPDSVTSIGDDAFYGCTGLTSVHISDFAAWCGISFESGYANPLYYAHNLYLNGLLVTSLVIPDSVSSIGSYAFYNCEGLTSVTILDSVTSIGNSAFSGCTGLTSVHITDFAAWCGISFESGYANPLYYAHNLYLNGSLVTNLVIPDSVSSVGRYAFYGCSGLTSVTIPDSVTSIGNSAFADCIGLTSVILPNKTIDINMYAFYGCVNWEHPMPNLIVTPLLNYNIWDFENPDDFNFAHSNNGTYEETGTNAIDTNAYPQMVFTYGRGAEVEASIVSEIDGVTLGGNHVLRLDYDYTQESGAANNVGTTGWQGSITEGTSFGTTDDIILNVGVIPKQIGAWVYAPEGTPNLWMRARYGFNGNVTQVNFTQQRKDAADGIGGINWTGWKFVTADIPNNSVGEYRLKKGELIRLLALSGSVTGNENGWWTVTGGFETDAEGNTVYATDENGDQVPVLAKRRLEQSEIKGSLYFDDIQFLYEDVEEEIVEITPPTCGKRGKRKIVVKGTVSGDIIGEQTESIPATNAHIPGEPIEETVIAPTCITNGKKRLQ